MENLLFSVYGNISPALNIAGTICKSGKCEQMNINLDWFVIPFISLFIFLAISISIITVVSFWKIFKKAGQPGWKSLIPIYNMIINLRIIKRPWWFLLLMFIPYINFVVGIIMAHDMSVSFGKGKMFTLGLLVLPFIFYPILAFGESKYTAPNRI